MLEQLEAGLAMIRAAFEDAERGSRLVGDAELEAEITAAQAAINAATAVQTLRVAQYAAREDVRLPDGRWVREDRGLGHVAEFGDAPIGTTLGLSSGAATSRTVTAAKIASCLPATLAAMAAGDLDGWRASVIADELRQASAETCLLVEAAIFPKVLDETGGRVRSRVRRTLLRLDADAVKQRVQRARNGRDVWVGPGEPGMSELVATLPAEDMARCYAAIDELAHRTWRDDPGRTLAQCRADALVDLILANATVTTTVMIGIPVETLTVRAPAVPGEPAWAELCAMGVEVPGVGVIPGHVVAGICDTFDTRLQRILLDTTTGVVRETGVATYRPGSRQVEFVRLRDGTCRFPGCSVRARRCDLDHVVPWPVGTSDPPNLACLCRRHHRLKTHTRWRLEMTPDGVCTWTSPVGDQFVTDPVDHLDALAA